MSARSYVPRISDTRTFIVRVSGSPPRVVVEDVRGRRRALVGDLPGVGAQIAVWLEASQSTAALEATQASCEDSVSPANYGRRLDQGKP